MKLVPHKYEARMITSWLLRSVRCAMMCFFSRLVTIDL
jgi:hypothetical protein